jgi:hypothetical protein
MKPAALATGDGTDLTASPTPSAILSTRAALNNEDR